MRLDFDSSYEMIIRDWQYKLFFSLDNCWFEKNCPPLELWQPFLDHWHIIDKN